MPTTSVSFWEEIAQRGIGSLAGALTDAEALAMTEAYGTHNYKPLPVNVVRAKGSECWDGEGQRFIDCIGAYSAVAHGHLNPAVVAALKEQLEKGALASRAVYTTEMALFMKGLAEYCGLDMVCPMNTGAEAVETAIKIARKWAYTVKGVPENEAEVIACEGNFHGRTTAIVGFSTEPIYREHFGPFAPGFKVIPYGDLDALEAVITEKTAAFLAEPIQAEGGIILPPDGYLARVRELCDRNSVLLIWDEVQTGFCRTGRRFAHEWEAAKPDIVAVGKPLGGGVMPVSAAVGRKSVMQVLTPGDHGSTFGGNPLGCAVALTALAEMEIRDYAGMSQSKGERLLAGLRSIKSDRVKEVRGRGLLVGLEVHDDVDSKRLAQNFLNERLLTKETRHRTFRFTPPIVIEEGMIDEIVEGTARALAAL